MSRTTITFMAIVGVAVAIALFARFGPGQARSVPGLIGSEKAPFFADMRVQKTRSPEISCRSTLKSIVGDVSYG
jgi:hypothetical protein